MSETRPSRGRPKGSGIDDRQQLGAIARLIASNPDLKPTTAIRAIGVSDPSVIRRLRDKFNVVRTELMQELQDTAAGIDAAKLVGPAEAGPDSPVKKSAPKGRLRPHTSTDRLRSLAALPLAEAGEARRASERPRAIPATKPSGKLRVAAVSDPQPAPPARNGSQRATAPARPSTPPSDEDGERAPASCTLTPVATQFFTTMLSASVIATSTLMAAHTTLANEFIRSPYMSLALRQQIALSEWAAGLVPLFPLSTKTAT